MSDIVALERRRRRTRRQRSVRGIISFIATAPHIMSDLLRLEAPDQSDHRHVIRARTLKTTAVTANLYVRNVT